MSPSYVNAVNATNAAKKGLSRRNRHLHGGDEDMMSASDEYAFLDTKPAAGRKWRGAKSRRHGGEALLQRKMAHRAYLMKSVVVVGGGGGGTLQPPQPQNKLGKKRRARLLSDHHHTNEEEFHESVPYSLNRKNRWNTMDTAGCVRRATNDLQQMSNADKKLKVKATVVERNLIPRVADREYQLQNGVTAFKEIGATECKNPRGTEPPPSSPPDLNVHYIVSKAPPSRFMSHYYINWKSSYKGSRRANPCVKIYEDELNPTQFDEEEEVALSNTTSSSNDDDENDLLPIEERVFTLADFVKDTSPPVIIQRQKSIMSIEDSEECNIEDQFVLADNDPIERDLVSFLSSSSSLKSRLEDARRKEKWLFCPLTLKASHLGIDSTATWLEQCNGLPGSGVKWLDSSNSHLLIDLSGQLDQSQAPLLMLVIGYVEDQLKLTVNANFKCSLPQLHQKEFNGGIKGLTELLVNVLQPHYANSIQQQQVQVKGTFSQKLSSPIQPTSPYDILMKPVPPLNECDSDSDEFEYIEMADIVNHHSSSSLESLVEEMCEKCSTPSTLIISLPSCPHKFCSNCYRLELTHRLDSPSPLAIANLRCLNNKCCCQVPVDILPVVVPLPIAIYISTLSYVLNQLKQGGNGKMVECNTCNGILIATSKEQQVACTKCDNHVCLSCSQSPHWPMTCDQSGEWSKKFEQQYELDCSRRQEQEEHSPPQNKISQLYSRICSQSRARRLDSQLAIQLAKHMRRVTNYKQERHFLELRKCALQLLEFGFGWLYMTRAEKKKNKGWTQLKAMLASLNAKVEALESEILFSSSLTNPKLLLKKVEECKQIMDLAIEKFKQQQQQ